MSGWCVWDTSSVITTNSMFRHATSFNSDIAKWGLAKVTDMASMFYGAASFNKDISRWDVSRVTDMTNMFHGAISFNVDISTWKVSRVVSMAYMFFGATSFNRDISKWDVFHVANMDWMFYRTKSFAQILCGTEWANSKATQEHMFTRSLGRICFGRNNTASIILNFTALLCSLFFYMHETVFMIAHRLIHPVHTLAPLNK